MLTGVQKEKLEVIKFGKICQIYVPTCLVFAGPVTIPVAVSIKLLILPCTWFPVGENNYL